VANDAHAFGASGLLLAVDSVRQFLVSLANGF
jgi:hypothetical protein